MSKLLESVLFDRINGAVAFFDADGLLIRTNAAWEMLCKSDSDGPLVLTYDDLVGRLGLESMRESGVMDVVTVQLHNHTFLVRRQRIQQDDCAGLMVEIEDISSITKKIEHTNRVFSDTMLKIRSRISSVQNVLTLFTDYQNEGFDAESLTLLRKTRREVWEMMRQMENLRYLSVVDTGTMDFEAHSAEYALKELVDGVVLDCSPLISAAHGAITIQVNMDEGMSVVTDRRILLKAVSVLLFNAIEYNDGEISISIDAERGEDSTVVSVTDNGWGIPASEQAQVFSYGFRGADAKKTSYSGSGAELYLVRKLLTVIHGTISFVSREGNGSTFTINLGELTSHEE